VTVVYGKEQLRASKFLLESKLKSIIHTLLYCVKIGLKDKMNIIKRFKKNQNGISEKYFLASALNKLLHRFT
jgi:hypothetical protein